jgi:hypothetical protein
MRCFQWALSWLVVFAVGLAPMLVYWVAGLIGRAFWSKARAHDGIGGGKGSRPAGNNGKEPKERRDAQVGPPM